MSNGKDPAFPVPYVLDEVQGLKIKYEVGLTKREYFAAMAIQGLLLKWDFSTFAPDEFAVDALSVADSLLAALEKTHEA